MQIWPEKGGILRRVGEWADRHPKAVGFALAVWYCSLVVKPALFRPLWHDELFTLYIAQSTTLGRMWQAIRTVDLNPPLSYLLARAALHIFKPQAFACRIPSLLAFLAGSLLLFAFLKRKTSTIYATLGVLLLWNTRLFYFATEARPYALVFGFTTVLLLAWQRAIKDEKRRLGLLILTLSGFGLLLSHAFGVCALTAFWLAEVVRCCVRRKPDWVLWACLLLPMISCVAYIPQVHNQSVILFPPQWQPSVERTTLIYQNIPVLIVLLVAAVWRRKPSPRQFPLNSPESVLLVCLLLVPIEISLLLARSHGALFERYGIVAVIPLAVLPVLLLAWSSRCNPGVGILLAVCLVPSLYVPLRIIAIEELPAILSPRQAGQIIRWAFPVPLSEQPVNASYGESASGSPVQLRGGLDHLHPELPIVAASALTFLEMDNREADSVARRLYYLTDPEASARISHATLFESYGNLKRVFPIRGTIEPYQDFVRVNPRFLVVGTYGYPEDWLLPKLQADGATAKHAWQLQPSYKDTDVYEISIPPQRPPVGERFAATRVRW
jgi:hypothetical protein